MLYFLQEIYINQIGFFRIFKSLVLRASLSFTLSLLLMILFCKPFIRLLRKIKMQDSVREDGPSHQQKNGTPTMGGLLIMVSILFTTIITGNFNNKFTIFLFFITILLTFIGFYDDLLKFKKSKKGLSAKKKVILQLIAVVCTYVFIYYTELVNKTIDFSLINPFIKKSYIYVGPVIFFIFIVFVIIGASNAVNLTDGLDGLVSGPIIIVFSTFMVIAYLVGNYKYSTYLNLYYIQGAGEIVVFIAAIVGATLGFLWFNFYPAEIFMGDTGSLALGGLLGIISIFLKLELLLPIAGFIFIIEALSVILQVFSYRKFKKRIFKMAPIHHHFEKLGMAETKVTVRFWIVTILTCLLTIVILKLR